MSDTIAIAKIRRDGGTQSRAEIHADVVDEYAALYADRGRLALPPAIVFFDGNEHWLGDGFHRVAAAECAGLPRVAVDIRQGTQRDAILFSVGANAGHGLRRTNADKRRAVSLLLHDDEWSQRSDRWIAEKCGVGHPLVAEMRHQLEDSSSCDVATGGVTEPQAATRTGKDGKKRRTRRASESGDSAATEEAEPEAARAESRFCADAEAMHVVNRVAALVGAWPDPGSLHVLVESLSQYVRRLEQRAMRNAS